MIRGIPSEARRLYVVSFHAAGRRSALIWKDIGAVAATFGVAMTVVPTWIYLRVFARDTMSSTCAA